MPWTWKHRRQPNLLCHTDSITGEALQLGQRIIHVVSTPPHEEGVPHDVCFTIESLCRFAYMVSPDVLNARHHINGTMLRDECAKAERKRGRPAEPSLSSRASTRKRPRS